MKTKLIIILCAWTLLTGCNALNRKCDYIPPNCCGRPDISYVYCGGCKHPSTCINGTCGACWRCDGHFNDS